MRFLAALGLFVAVAGCSGGEKASPLAAAARSCLHDPEGACSIPIFTVHDLRAAQRYYGGTLGFKLEWEDGSPPDFASVARGANGRVFLCLGCQGTPGAWAMMLVPDVDKYHAQIKAKGARVRMPPTDMPWRLREMHVSDVDGNVLRFGSPIEH